MTSEIDYKCSKCGEKNVKLWRDTHVFLDYIKLKCASCLTDKKKYKVDENGKCLTDYGSKTDQAAGMVPAVPTEDNTTFWGYTSVPESGVQWWKKLPTYSSKNVGFEN